MHVKITTTEESTLISNAIQGNYQATIWRQFGGQDPDGDSVWWNGANTKPPLALNMARNVDPRIDDAIRVGRTSHKENERQLAYIVLARQLAKDLPYVWLEPHRLGGRRQQQGPRLRPDHAAERREDRPDHQRRRADDPDLADELADQAGVRAGRGRRSAGRAGRRLATRRPSSTPGPKLRKPPAAPIDRIDPLEPIDRIDPAEPIDRIDPTLPTDSSDPADRSDHDDATDPTDRFDSTDARLR